MVRRSTVRGSRYAVRKDQFQLHQSHSFRTAAEIEKEGKEIEKEGKDPDGC